MENFKFRNAKDAFQNAIAQGKLSVLVHNKNYAGNYMYMHTTSKDQIDHFKNIDTRKYDVSCPVK